MNQERHDHPVIGAQVCVIVPTYNNGATLGSLLVELANTGIPVIVIDDGSTDETSSVLDQHPDVIRIAHATNRGKGRALRNAFREALDRGFTHAISIDSDGQHFPRDISVFLEALKQDPSALYVGQRNMDQPNVPGKSNFGRRFSNFWFRVDTGIRLEDTQSGFRLYPLEAMKDIHWITNRFEFEVEVLVRSAWKGIPVKGVPVSVFYPPPGERISHFRPLPDFTRISILNTFLFLGAIFYYWPMRLLRAFLPGRWRHSLREALMNPEEKEHVKVASIALGLFMGIVPIWGFQLMTAIALAFLLRLNKVLVVLAANISIPPMIPLIIWLSLQLGRFWMPGEVPPLAFSADLSWHDIDVHARQYVFGSITLAVLTALGGGLITLALLKARARMAGVTGG